MPSSASVLRPIGKGVGDVVWLPGCCRNHLPGDWGCAVSVKNTVRCGLTLSHPCVPLIAAHTDQGDQSQY
jgi:hypothetical protein